MQLQPLARPVVRLCTLLGALAAFASVACAERAQRAGAADAQQPPVAVRDSAPRAQVDTVDSLTASWRATVMDTNIATTPVSASPDRRLNQGT